MDYEKGTVVAIDDKEIIVEFHRSSACEKCGACMMAKDTGKMIIRLPNKKKVEVGDEVYVDIERNFYLFSTAMLYVLPLTVLIASIVVALMLLAGDNAQIIAAMIGIVLSFGSYFALRLFKKKFANMKTKNMSYYKA